MVWIRIAGVAEQADAQDLKSCDPTKIVPVRFRSPAPLQLNISAGWSSLVARRAHNPEVIGSNPIPATIIFYTIRKYLEGATIIFIQLGSTRRVQPLFLYN